MFEAFANIFGYLLQPIYTVVNNYGLAIILFTVIIKLLLLPLSIKQQRTMKKSIAIQDKVKAIQFKYKNDPEKMNQELMNLYKTEKVSPFGGCLTAIIQVILLASIFYLVKCPLTFMEKIPEESINTYIKQLTEAEKPVNQVYPEIDIIRENEFLKEKNPEDANIDKAKIEMNLLGLDLSKIPQQNLTDYKVYIIPLLYILSTSISIKLTTRAQEKQKQEKKEDEPIVIKEDSKELVPQDEEEVDPMMQMNKTMSWMMPIISLYITFIAPLGLALYWLMNNILMIIERIVLDKVIKS